MNLNYTIYSLNLKQLLDQLKSKKKSLGRKTVELLKEKFAWSNESDELLEAAKKVLIDHDFLEPNAGLILHGVALQCELILLGEEWKAWLYEDLAEVVEDVGLSEQACELLNCIAYGRTPFLESINGDSEIVASFLTQEEGKGLLDELSRTREIRRFGNEEVTATICEHLIPALEHDLKKDHCYYFISL